MYRGWTTFIIFSKGICWNPYIKKIILVKVFSSMGGSSGKYNEVGQSYTQHFIIVTKCPFYLLLPGKKKSNRLTRKTTCSTTFRCLAKSIQRYVYKIIVLSTSEHLITCILLMCECYHLWVIVQMCKFMKCVSMVMWSGFSDALGIRHVHIKWL